MKKIFFQSAYAVIIAAAFLFYVPALFNGFVWDDFMLFASNKFVHHWDNLKYLFSPRYLTSPQEAMFMTCQTMIGSGEGVYRPVTTLSYFLDYAVWKLNPLGFHLTNIVLHAICGCLVYRLIRYWIPSVFAALVGALLFVMHPIQMEAVAVPSMRDDILALMFYLAAIHCYMIYREKPAVKYYAGLLVFFVLAVFSKEMAFTLPVMLWAVEVYRPLSAGKKRVPFHQDIFSGRYWILYGLSAVCLLIWAVVMHRPVGFILQYPGNSLWAAFLTMIRVMGDYVSWLVYPLSLHHTVYADEAFIIRSLSQWELWQAVLKIAAITGVFIWLQRRIHVLGFAMVWSMVAFLPASGVLPMENIMGARFLYLPSVGMALAAAMIWNVFEERQSFAFGLGLLFGRMIIGALAGFYLLTTWSHVLRLKNNFSFQHYLVEHYPRHPKARLGLASVYYWDKGDFRRAIEHALIADSIDPTFVLSHQLLGLIYAEQGDWEKSLHFNRKMFELTPEHYKKQLNSYWDQFLEEFPALKNREGLSCSALRDMALIETLIGQDVRSLETVHMADECHE